MTIGSRQRATGNGKNLKLVAYALCAMLFEFCPIASAQQSTGVYRIGILRPDTPAAFSPRKEVFRQTLRALGYIEEKNIRIDYRYAEGKLEKLPQLAAELIQSKVDVIVTGGTRASEAAKQGTSSIPIVVGGAGDLSDSAWFRVLQNPAGMSPVRATSPRT